MSEHDRLPRWVLVIVCGIGFFGTVFLGLFAVRMLDIGWALYLSLGLLMVTALAVYAALSIYRRSRK